MECTSAEIILLIICHMLSLHVTINSRDLTSNSLINDNCGLHLVTFSDCVNTTVYKNSMIRSRHHSSNLYNSPIKKYTDSTDNTVVIANMRVCCTRYADSEIFQHFCNITIAVKCAQIVFYRRGKAIILFETIKYLCHNWKLQLSEQRCIRVFSRLQTCLEYHTSRNISLLFSCTLCLDVNNSSQPADPPSLRMILKSSHSQVDHQQIVTNDQLPVLKAANFHEQISTNKVLCPTRNCTFLKKIKRDSQPQTTCPFGRFGKNCKDTCHCQNKEPCNTFTGVCKSRKCALGWKGVSCSQRICPVGLYGMSDDHERCKKTCSCLTKNDCNILNGECEVTLCLNFTTVTECSEQICPRHYLGFPYCQMRCHCSHDMMCHPITGVCISNLCMAGYMPPKCVNRRYINVSINDFALMTMQVALVVAKVMYALHLRVLPLLTA